MAKTYTYAIFDSKQRAHDAIDALDDRFQARKIDVLVRDPDTDVTHEIPLYMRTSVGTGIAVGAAFGVVALTVVALATTLLSSDPLLAVLDGVLIGSFAGGLVGAVAGLGRWKTEPDLPEEMGDDAVIMVGVATESERNDVARQALAAAGARQISIIEGKTARAA